MRRLRCPYCHKPSTSLGALHTHIRLRHPVKAEQIAEALVSLLSYDSGSGPSVTVETTWCYVKHPCIDWPKPHVWASNVCGQVPSRG